MKLDILAFAAHPDDIELCAGGTLLKMAHEGKKTGIIDLTAGDLGSRGSAKLRLEEAQVSAKILGLSARENLLFRDGFFTHDEVHQKKIIQMIRKYRPEIVLANSISDRHPDHGRASKLVRDAVFLSGLKRIETELDGESQVHWRPRRIFFYIQDYNLPPDFVVDITPFYAQRLEALKAFKSQFFDPNSKEEATYISSEDFWNFLDARARNVGHTIGVTFGEGFQCETPLKVENILMI